MSDQTDQRVRIEQRPATEWVVIDLTDTQPPVSCFDEADAREYAESFYKVSDPEVVPRRPLRAKVHKGGKTTNAEQKDRWWVTLIAANGEPLAHSEMLSSRANAAKNAAAMGVAPEHIEWPKDSE